MKILIVLTSHDKLGNTGRKTGFWLEDREGAPRHRWLIVGSTDSIFAEKALYGSDMATRTR